jgi:hypothetical protein
LSGVFLTAAQAVKEENKMEMPNHPGWCPFYCGENGDIHCGLSGCLQDSDHREYACKSAQNYKTCGNYEAWKNGSNYQ